MHYRVFAVLVPFLLPIAASAADTPGATPKTAIEVCEPIGEQAYLKQLVCPDGKPPLFERKGNVGWRNEPASSEIVLATSRDREALMRNNIPAGVPDFHFIDEYDVTCSGQPTQKIYMDMYHCGALPSFTPPASFTLNVDPDILLFRNEYTRTKPTATEQKLIDRLYQCEAAMMFGSKLPFVKNPREMKLLYPRLNFTAIMLGGTSAQYRTHMDAIKERTKVDDKLAVAREFSKEADVCFDEFSKQADELKIFNWRSDKLRRLYPESDAAYRAPKN